MLPVIVTTNTIIIICDFLVLRIRAHFAEVPQAEGLILPVGNHVSTITFRRNVRNPFRVSDQYTRGLLRRTYRATIPSIYRLVGNAMQNQVSGDTPDFQESVI
jgi:hypothetical protein